MVQSQILLVFVSDNQALCLRDSTQAFQSTNYSIFTTLSAFMCHHFPDLPPPNFQDRFQPQKPINYPSSSLCFSKYFEPWSQYLSFICKDHSNGYCSKIGNQYCVFKYIDFIFFKLLEQQNQKNKIFAQLTLNELSTALPYCRHWGNNKTQKNIAILVLMERAHGDKIRPTNNEISTFSGIWFQSGDYWTSYQIIKGQIPSAIQLSIYDAIFLSGSELCINDYNHNISELQDNILQAMKLNKKLKIVGICFGHQLIARMFDAKIQRKEFRSGIQHIQIHREVISKLPYMEELAKFSECCVAKVHSDYVMETPSEFEIIVSSAGCPNEGMISRDRRFLSFQCHPEVIFEGVVALHERLQRYYENDVTFKSSCFQKFKDTQKEYSQIKQKHHQSTEAIRKTIRKFIDYD